MTRAAIMILISLASLLILISSSYGILAKSEEVAIMGTKALLSEGEAMKVTIQAEKPTVMNEISFSVRTIGLSDPFAALHRIPITIEVYEGDQLVASESFTELLDGKLEKVNVPINNMPKMEENYKLLIRYDTPENGGHKNIPIQIDTESIRINEGDDGIEVHGRVTIVSSTS